MLVGSAWAQQPQKPSPELEAMGQKLMVEINAGIQCNANAIAGRNRITELETEVARLKAKYEPEAKDAK